MIYFYYSVLFSSVAAFSSETVSSFLSSSDTVTSSAFIFSTGILFVLLDGKTAVPLFETAPPTAPQPLPATARPTTADSSRRYRACTFPRKADASQLPSARGPKGPCTWLSNERQLCWCSSLGQFLKKVAARLPERASLLF